MEGNFGWIELVFFYGIAIGVAFWQWWKMRRELRESRARKAAEERGRAETEESSSNSSPAASDREA